MVEIDVRKEMRRAVDTGKVLFGEKSSEKSILKGNGELLILSSNILREKAEKFKHFAKLSEIPVLDFDGTSIELGSVCGKPFMVSAMVVQDKGKSRILTAVKTR